MPAGEGAQWEPTIAGLLHYVTSIIPSSLPASQPASDLLYITMNLFCSPMIIIRGRSGAGGVVGGGSDETSRLLPVR